MARKLPHESQRRYLVYAGTGTDLIFNHGRELPGFASFPLLEKPGTRSVLANQMRDLVEVAQTMELGCILDAPTWMANADRAADGVYDEWVKKSFGRLAGLMPARYAKKERGEDVVTAPK